MAAKAAAEKEKRELERRLQYVKEHIFSIWNLTSCSMSLINTYKKYIIIYYWVVIIGEWEKGSYKKFFFVLTEERKNIRKRGHVGKENSLRLNLRLVFCSCLHKERERKEKDTLCVCNRVDRYDLKGIPVDTLNIKTMRLLIMIKTTKCIRSYEL